MLELARTEPFPIALPQGRTLAVAAVADLGLATLLPQRGHDAEVAAVLKARLGLELEDRPVRVAAGGLAAMGIGPGKWLVSSEGTGNHLARRLREVVGDAAGIEDQSDGYAVLRLSGAGCRAVLARGVNIDLDPARFAPGAVAVSSIAHVGVILWRREDDGLDPLYELACFRSMAGSLLHWLDRSIAGAGLALA